MWIGSRRDLGWDVPQMGSGDLLYHDDGDHVIQLTNVERRHILVPPAQLPF